MTRENWKPIKGYEGLYEVSNTGQIRSLDRNNGKRKGKMLKRTIGSNGYLRITLCKNSIPVTKEVHRFVAETFLPNPDNLPCVNHKDENKMNNNVNNLEWCTREYNSSYGTKTERELITKGIKPFVCIETGTTYTNQHQCARELGIDQSSISKVLKCEYTHTSGYHFKYLDAKGAV